MKAFTELINADTGRRCLHAGAQDCISSFENSLQPKQLSESPLLRSIRRNSTTPDQEPSTEQTTVQATFPPDAPLDHHQLPTLLYRLEFTFGWQHCSFIYCVPETTGVLKDEGDSNRAVMDKYEMQCLTINTKIHYGQSCYETIPTIY